jgi:hypothetical protein
LIVLFNIFEVCLTKYLDKTFAITTQSPKGMWREALPPFWTLVTGKYFLIAEGRFEVVLWLAGLKK